MTWIPVSDMHPILVTYFFCQCARQQSVNYFPCQCVWQWPTFPAIVSDSNLLSLSVRLTAVSDLPFRVSESDSDRLCVTVRRKLLMRSHERKVSLVNQKLLPHPHMDKPALIQDHVTDTTWLKSDINSTTSATPLTIQRCIEPAIYIQWMIFLHICLFGF